MAENTENMQNNENNSSYYILWDRYAKVTFKVKNGSETEEIEFERFQVEMMAKIRILELSIKGLSKV